jgi:hypothetical protein
MSKGDSFPSIHGQLDVKGLAFQILDAPSSFSVRLHFTLAIHFAKSIFKIGCLGISHIPCSSQITKHINIVLTRS